MNRIHKTAPRRTKTRSTTSIPLLILMLLVASGARVHANDVVPEAWNESWNSPPSEDRPLLIVHHIPSDRTTPESLNAYTDYGLGGLATNVAFQEYMQSDRLWNEYELAIDACAERGLTVWIYDEDGYPSGGAGGQVLEGRPDLEALELAFDANAEGDDRFIVRPSYEFSHAANNYAYQRRYINLLNAEACRRFIDVTHEEYRKRVGRHFGETIVATFTDEPSLMAVNLGLIPEQARGNVRVFDPLDPDAVSLPAVAWSADLPALYRERYEEDLLPLRKSLFTGDTERDRQTRRRYWSLVGDLVAENYYGQIQDWCHENGLLSSGHTLAEESILHQVGLHGNGLQALRRMDMPGMDMLSSDPTSVVWIGWMTAGLPASAARLEGRRRLMTEVSDFQQKQSGEGPASLDDMRATAAWQAAWGVTEFTLYYGQHDRSREEFHAYCDFVGRLNAVLKPATPTPRVLLYYPIHDLWEEYRPQAEKLTLESQSERAQQIVHSFNRCGQMLQQHQIPFTLIDHETLARASVSPTTGTLNIADLACTHVVLPDGVDLPSNVEHTLSEFINAGGHIARDGVSEPNQSLALEEVVEELAPLSPYSQFIALGEFTRDDRSIKILTNVGEDAYEGRLQLGVTSETAMLMKPADGSSEEIRIAESSEISLSLASKQTVLIIANQTP